MKLSDIKINPTNPRFIKDDKFKKLVKSIKELPIMLNKLRKVMVDENNMVIGGNMRLRALQEIGYTEIPTEQFTREDAIENNKLAKKLDPEYKDKTYEEQCRELIIKDNLEYGQNDWDLLSEQYEKEELEDWGMDVDKWEDIDFENIKSNEDREANDKKQSVTCPDCGKTFEV